LKYHGINNQIIIFDDLFPFFEIIISNHAFATEKQPFGKSVVRFYFICGRRNLLS